MVLEVEDAQPVTLARLVQPLDPGSPVASEFQQELLAMAALGEVPGVAGKAISIGDATRSLRRYLLLG